MILTYLFILAGIAIAMLLVAKRIEEKRKKEVFFLKLISKGDARARDLHQHTVRLYSITKERAHFFVMKQLPRYSKSSMNKALANFEEKMERYLERLRDSKLLGRKDEGISEFFKSMAEVEKGVGEINDNIYIGEVEAIKEEVIEVEETKEAVEETKPIEVIETPKKTRRPRAKKTNAEVSPKKRRLKVVEVVGEE